MSESGLTVAVTGPTGTFGHGLLPQLEADDRVSKVVGLARRPFDPAAEGWTKMEYRRGDVRDPQALAEAFADVDVVVHLAFLIVGGSRERTRAVNVEGTLNVFRAAAAAGARRFVYASSVAAYGFHRDNPYGMREEWPTRPADRLFYAQEKAELEELLRREAAAHPDLDLYLLRPPIVLGPHAVGAKAQLPGFVAGLARRAFAVAARSPLRLPVLLPDLDIQFVHEEDVGLALLQCVVAAGPAGAYNIAADDVLGVHDVARELGMLPLPLPTRPTRVAARALARTPGLPAVAEWVEAASHPAVMDTSRARRELGWEPQWTAREALRDTFRR
jgi:nucleoside-diphosphate-sugar epimerase